MNSLVNYANRGLVALKSGQELRHLNRESKMADSSASPTSPKFKYGSLAQLVRVLSLQDRSRWFESSKVHHFIASLQLLHRLDLYDVRES